MSTTCKYCKEAEDKQSNPGLVCEICSCFVHITCLRRPGTPGDLAGDVFFEFTCEDCSPDRKEVFVRFKFPWVNVIYLTLNQLCTQSYGIGHHGYFHYKTHICSFIDRYWQTLFGVSNKQKKNWIGTIAGVLSVYNKILFKSGLTALGEAGWWRLLHNFSPAVASHIVQELARDKPKNRPRNMALDRNHFVSRISEMGYKDLLNLEMEDCQESEVVPCKKRRLDSQDSVLSGTSYYDQVDSDAGRTELIEESTFEDSFQILSGNEISFVEMGQELTDMKTYEYEHNDGNNIILPLQSDTSSIQSLRQSVHYDSDSRSSDQEKQYRIKKVEEKPYTKRDSLFSTELNSVENPWEVEFGRSDGDIPREELVPMTEYEEVHLLKKIEGMVPKVKDLNKKTYLYRLKAKLALRRLKRHKRLPIFDLDKTVKLLGGYVTEDTRENAVSAERVLDRFQKSYIMDNLCGTVTNTTYGTVMVSDGEECVTRATSGASLRPYIRRDYSTSPTWLRLMDDLMRKTHRHIPGYSPPARDCISYSYIRPHHVPAVNALCAHYFWPGIDLTETLQYPEHSCVVTYKRLVVGCAFLVPNVRTNEAYISFIVTRPEWQRAGIGAFMLYHLLQTCTGQDVTLHVSPTNPAIFLYQKFGFKVEEFVQDFYEKYFDIDYKGCRHALFLRLVR